MNFTYRLRIVRVEDSQPDLVAVMRGGTPRLKLSLSDSLGQVNLSIDNISASALKALDMRKLYELTLTEVEDEHP